MKLDPTVELASNTLTTQEFRLTPYENNQSDSTANDDSNSDQDQDDNEQFEDAVEKLANLDNTQPSMPTSSTDNGRPETPPSPATSSYDLKSQLQDTSQVLALALNNKFIEALDICGQKANEQLYSSLAHATLSFLRASLTMEPNDLEAALDAINRASSVASSCRKKSSVISQLIYRQNYNTYSDEQIHAELVHAESLLLLSLISFLSDQSIICLIRGALRIRTCYQRYKDCLQILETRNNWSSELAKRHFESGVRMGYGTFNLLMSYLPRRVLRILEYVGFSGNRSVGVNELDRAIQLDDGLRSVLSALIILCYHSYIENLFGLGHYEPEKVEQVSELLLQRHPNSAFFLLFRGRYHQMQGQLDLAIGDFQHAIECQDDWVQFHSICHWEIMWCHAVQMHWTEAAHYADLLRRKSKWSPASYTYQYATFKYAQLVEDYRQSLVNRAEFEDRLKEISEIIERVPKLRVRLAGKTIPAEKFAIMRTEKFFQQSNRLTLPTLEFLYIWNIFVTLRNSPQIVERLLIRINSEIDHIECQMKFQQQLQKQQLNLQQVSSQDQTELNETTSSTSSSGHSTGDMDEEDEIDLNENISIDDLCLALLLKAMCLKRLNRLDESELCLAKVITSEPEILRDTFLVPHAAMEMALIKLEREQYGESREWLRIARNDHTGYLHETMVHFKLHAISRLIRISLREQDLGNTSTDSKVLASQNHKPVQTSEMIR